MQNLPFLFLLTIGLAAATNDCKGCMNLDEYNFDKILARFQVVLVKFDVAYPYGDKHDAFAAVAGDIADNPNLILGEVGVKDYGEKDNELLAARFGVKTKEELPALRLFVHGSDPVAFPKDSAWTSDNLKEFIRDNTNIYIGLPGCLEHFDKLAMEFVQDATNKDDVIKQTEHETNKLTEKDKPIAETYLKFMRKILEQGVQFVKHEVARLGNIVKLGKVNEKKKMELSYRLNILRSFNSPTAKKSEL